MQPSSNQKASHSCVGFPTDYPSLRHVQKTTTAGRKQGGLFLNPVWNLEMLCTNPSHNKKSLLAQQPTRPNSGRFCPLNQRKRADFCNCNSNNNSSSQSCLFFPFQIKPDTLSRVVGLFVSDRAF
mmetsp:Transcript_25181/g.55263  ORF Transcript_25181/g.55263 Transcript_25181/m.55263 type:complete len:125 (+) Transcript_25181:166-540(+)